MTPSTPNALDNNTRMAIERTWLAYERTQMAWVRTATSLISFGFTIYKFFEFESGRGAPASDALLTPRQFGMIMIGIGLTALVLSTIEHHQNIRRLKAELGSKKRSVAVFLAVVIAAMGVLAFVAALLRG